ncbi:hypothetical protein AWRI1631_164190 [Saccharomyces cerevisiae AWRI1631]|uniref:Uncharacterized protein n=1 Tax=Saccharomyces cerevisiae (strain AWRI1631) TaxID=545124 RepID=B5VTV6_YEAS6|nr:hypothetical protein AWRI1631_164190 [Saccharomyces cerevisiae AWRI1631]
MVVLAAKSGNGIYILLSNLLLMALSSCHGIFVAPRTKTPWESFPTPFICTNNSVLILLLASLSPSPLVPVSASTSSIKIIEGLFSLAIANNCLTSFSDSPIHLETKSLELTLKKVELASVATAFAKYDLPVPGGPYNKIPEVGLRLPLNKCGNLTGKITASLRASLAPSSPATSSHLTLGFSDKIALDKAPLSFLLSSPPLSSPSS